MKTCSLFGSRREKVQELCCVPKKFVSSPCVTHDVARVFTWHFSHTHEYIRLRFEQHLGVPLQSQERRVRKFVACGQITFFHLPVTAWQVGWACNHNTVFDSIQARVFFSRSIHCGFIPFHAISFDFFIFEKCRRFRPCSCTPSIRTSSCHTWLHVIVLQKIPTLFPSHPTEVFSTSRHVYLSTSRLVHFCCISWIGSSSAQHRFFYPSTTFNVFGLQDTASFHLFFLFQFVPQQFITHQCCPLSFPAFYFLRICVVFSTIVQFNCVATHRTIPISSFSNTTPWCHIYLFLSQNVPFHSVSWNSYSHHTIPCCPGCFVMNFDPQRYNTNVEEDHLTVRRDLKSHQHKNRKSMVDCFPAQERRNRTCLRAIHQPFSRTTFSAASCSAAHCADFLVVACLDREILGHTLLQLARPLSEKSSRPQFPILVSSISIASKSSRSARPCQLRELHLRESLRLFPRDTHVYILCLASQSWSGVFPPNIPNFNAHAGISSLDLSVACDAQLKMLRLHFRSSGSQCLFTLQDTLSRNRKTISVVWMFFLGEHDKEEHTPSYGGPFRDYTPTATPSVNKKYALYRASQ